MIGILAETNFDIGNSIRNLSEMVLTTDHCLVGIFAIIIWIICLIPFSRGIIAGSFINCLYLIIGLMLHSCISHTSYGTEMMYLVDHDGLGYRANTSVCVPSFFQEKYNTSYIDSGGLPSDVYYLKSEEGIQEIEDQLGYKTDENMLRFYTGKMGYAMHISSSGRYLCPSWVFNPFSLIVIPGICSIPAFIILGLLKGIFK